jgi:hypothetical protein
MMKASGTQILAVHVIGIPVQRGKLEALPRIAANP